MTTKLVIKQINITTYVSMLYLNKCNFVLLVQIMMVMELLPNGDLSDHVKALNW